MTNFSRPLDAFHDKKRQAAADGQPNVHEGLYVIFVLGIIVGQYNEQARRQQDKGVNAMLIYETNKVFIKHNILRVESNPELETNAKVRAQWRFYEERQHKRRRCYIKELIAV